MSDVPNDQPEPPQPGVSLRELSEAFARALGGQLESQSEQAVATDHPEAPTGPVEGPQPAQPELAIDAAGQPLAPGEEPAADDDPCQISPRTILEAMLFVGNQQSQPLTSQRAAELMRGVQPEEIPAWVEELNRRYESGGCPYEVVSEGDGYRRAKFYGRAREARLSQAAVDVLAIVAYRQPLTAEAVHRFRGTPSNHVLAQLVHRQLLRVERTGEKPRKSVYSTTNRFLALFGLESLGDLPQSEELEKR
jgi:segregation and condensation protein B